MSGRVPDDPLVYDDLLIRDNRQGGTCRAVSRKVLDHRWVLDDPMVHEDKLICVDYQGEACRAMSGRVPNDPL